MKRWIDLREEKKLQDLEGMLGYALIFKHSTRCPVSMMAKKGFERDADGIPADIPLYYLDLIAHRQLSSLVAELFNVQHESPQVLLLKDGKCAYAASHEKISVPDIVAHIVR